ncbi:hypothetical protein SADUNF_Sadunf10G0160600 [Salix dunnii]|uniref:Dolichyl-diphosphooligosaccharide--protein glycosyltransferase subunit 4A n=1 Tax=Salix dunnii TaxID=1413687 RepID=A0A835JTE5_9ROSI|nr:hypothetical protein SADUNF_Sadunf10G0160600 [Salix dunnii]
MRIKITSDRMDIALESGLRGRMFESHCDRILSLRRCYKLIRTDVMFDDQDLGFFANFLGIFIFVLVIAYHYVMADPKYEGN